MEKWRGTDLENERKPCVEVHQWGEEETGNLVQSSVYLSTTIYLSTYVDTRVVFVVLRVLVYPLFPG